VTHRIGPKPAASTRTAWCGTGLGTEFVLPTGRSAQHHEHMARYGDYCPIAVGVDVLGDRWTPLVIRELMVGAGGFNEIHRGIPRISRTMLAQRLRLLERRGLVRREPGTRGRPGRYTLTSAGESVTPVIWAIGHWAAEWIFADPTDQDCDGLSVMWNMHKQAIEAKLPCRSVTWWPTATPACSDPAGWPGRSPPGSIPPTSLKTYAGPGCTTGETPCRPGERFQARERRPGKPRRLCGFPRRSQRGSLPSRTSKGMSDALTSRVDLA
jgi:DNA-binding HxlR family transcriptional regulator